MDNLVYLYDGSFEGILSCVFEAYVNKEKPCLIAMEDGLQVTFGQSIRCICSDLEKTKRVEAGLVKKVGQQGLENAWLVFLSNDSKKDLIAFNYICLGLKVGRKIYSMLTHEDVLPVSNICFNINREADHLQGFVRFSLMENGVFFSRITPKNNVVPIIMPHFVDRYSIQPFVIYDANHKVAGIYDLNIWELVKTEGVTMPSLAEGEDRWIKLWRQFCNDIAIKERINLSLQRNMCYKRFWENMPEMNGIDYSQGTKLRNSSSFTLKLTNLSQGL